MDLVVSPAGTLRATPDIRAEIITRDRFAVFVRRGHPFSRKKAVSLRDLRTAQWVAPDARTAMYRQIEALFAAQNEPWPQTLVSTNSITTLKSLIMWSDFVTISSTVLMHPEVEAGISRGAAVARRTGQPRDHGAHAHASVAQRAGQSLHRAPAQGCGKRVTRALPRGNHSLRWALLEDRYP